MVITSYKIEYKTEASPLSVFIHSNEKYCPFINPALQNEVLFHTVVELPELSYSTEEVSTAFFITCLKRVENCRVFRSQDPKNGILFCDNVSLSPSSLLTVPILEEVHWMLKCLYSSVGLMFGKFWPGELTISRHGNLLPDPNIKFISIRSAIKMKDPYFLDNTPNLLNQLLMSKDTGEDPLQRFLNNENDDWAAYTMQEQVSLFTKVNVWARSQLKNEI